MTMVTNPLFYLTILILKLLKFIRKAYFFCIFAAILGVMCPYGKSSSYRLLPDMWK